MIRACLFSVMLVSLASMAIYGQTASNRSLEWRGFKLPSERSEFDIWFRSEFLHGPGISSADHDPSKVVRHRPASGVRPSLNSWSKVMGIHDREIAVKIGPREQRFANLDSDMSSLGYRRAAGVDILPRQGVQKVIVFGKLSMDGDVIELTAGAIQNSDGTYTLQIDATASVSLAAIERLCGEKYGCIVAMYERLAR